MRLSRAIVPPVIVAAALVGLGLASRIDPAAYDPPPSPEFAGPLAPNTAIQSFEVLARGELVGPEDVDLDAQGRIYVGNEDGKILRLVPGPSGTSLETFADTGGRPLGLDFGPDGTLWVADSSKGLVSIDPEGRATVRVGEVDGIPLRFADDVDVGPDGRVYFSDASTRHGIDELHLESLEARPWGRLIVYDPATDTARVLLEGLYFANGVAVAPDGSFVLVNETFRYRVRRYWLSGPRAGDDAVFAEDLPGFPDGIASDGSGSYWVALYSPRVPLLDNVLHPRPWLKRLVSWAPKALMSLPKAYGLALKLDRRGRVAESLHDPSGEHFPFVTSAEEFDGVLYLGTVEGDAIARGRR